MDILKKKYGEEYLLAVDSPAEAVRALGIQLPGFKALVRKGEFHVLIGDKKIDETELTITAGTIDTIHFVPLAVGSKDDGILKVILGVVLNWCWVRCWCRGCGGYLRRNIQ